MKPLSAAILSMAIACPWASADSPQPATARLWTRADLESLSSTLQRTRTPYTQLLGDNTYEALLLRRAVSGEPELHVKLNDFFVVLDGEGEIEVGGRVTGERTVSPDEKRGADLMGGVVYRVKRGDVLFVPANHWLRVIIAKGQVLRALIVKTE